MRQNWHLFVIYLSELLSQRSLQGLRHCLLGRVLG